MPYDRRQLPANAREAAMDQSVREIRAEDIDPRYNWNRALPALGLSLIHI